MKNLPLLLVLVAATAASLPAQSPLPQPPRATTAYVLLAPLEADRLITDVRTADDTRLEAMMAGDAARLDAIFSDDLRYAHSNGQVENKKEFIKSLSSRHMVYESFTYQERRFEAVGPGVVLMAGRVIINASSAGQKLVLNLNFLAVWREEGGRWRFLAWQSSRNPPPPQ
jgi:ketosteroid isomerase-like protein